MDHQQTTLTALVCWLSRASVLAILRLVESIHDNKLSEYGNVSVGHGSSSSSGTARQMNNQFTLCMTADVMLVML